MKKLFIVSILLFFLISSILATDPVMNDRQLVPPQWILGIWDDNMETIGFEFT